MTEAPGRTIVTDKDGKQILTITFVGTGEAADPGLGTIRSKTVTTDVAGQVRTTFQIEVDQQNGGPNDPTEGFSYEIVAATRTEPIEGHPNFSEPYLFPKDKKFIKDKLNEIVSVNALPDLSSCTDPDRAASLFGYLASGLTSYYVPSLVIRKTYQASSPPSARQVGKIAQPGVSIPGTPKGATFLLISVSARGSRGKYSVTEEYEMSGEGGWDTFLYG